jgi:hypothetical protein
LPTIPCQMNHSVLLHPISLRSILVLSLLLNLSPVNCHFTSGFPNKSFRAFLFSTTRSTELHRFEHYNNIC